ncbi:M20/M25/M40 family metallo-hydrolase [Candidatus Bipolaricaulota bacterium]|nr:M20/M25/M40 family metallo-hydrolase [Candidatus Bipolaricaulota bacterium]
MWIETFCEMVRVDSESGDEARFIEHLRTILQRELGHASEVDAYGNLICRIPAKNSEADPVLLAAHADTVSPGKGIEPIIENGIIRSAGDTILGADDKAGIAEIIHALQKVERHPPVEIVVVRNEEIGFFGSKNLDVSLVTAKRGILMDSDVLDAVVIGGPSHFLLDITVHGRAAHAGMEPEKGISAIRTAALAIAEFPEGRVDEETTANVGTIHGGIIRNGIPDTVELKAECRSLDDNKAQALCEQMERAFRKAASDRDASVEIRTQKASRAYRLSETQPMVQTALRAIASVGLAARTNVITGGTDASVYNNKGIETVVMGIGARNEHSTQESIAISDMEKATDILCSMLRELS